jgi:hypothetical protein
MQKTRVRHSSRGLSVRGGVCKLTPLPYGITQKSATELRFVTSRVAWPGLAWPRRPLYPIRWPLASRKRHPVLAALSGSDTPTAGISVASKPKWKCKRHRRIVSWAGGPTALVAAIPRNAMRPVCHTSRNFAPHIAQLIAEKQRKGTAMSATRTAPQAIRGYDQGLKSPGRSSRSSC